MNASVPGVPYRSWALLERRQRAERLAALLDELDRTDGPLPADPEEDSRLDRLLGGAA
ncbi:MAG: hypothetical protein ACT4NP_14150 [Pseudonocardiales bacterium]